MPRDGTFFQPTGTSLFHAFHSISISSHHLFVPTFLFSWFLYSIRVRSLFYSRFFVDFFLSRIRSFLSSKWEKRLLEGRKDRCFQVYRTSVKDTIKREKWRGRGCEEKGKTASSSISFSVFCSWTVNVRRSFQSLAQHRIYCLEPVNHSIFSNPPPPPSFSRFHYFTKISGHRRTTRKKAKHHWKWKDSRVTNLYVISHFLN